MQFKFISILLNLISSYQTNLTTIMHFIETSFWKIKKQKISYRNKIKYIKINSANVNFGQKSKKEKVLQILTSNLR